MRLKSLTILCALFGLTCIGIKAKTIADTEARMAEDTPRNLDTHHIFTPPDNLAVWKSRAKDIREQILFSAGLLPMPEKTPLHPLITGKIEGPDYTIENVALETRPGFYLCGNLYRPKGKPGKHPGIANPHGHWANGRLEMQADVPKAPPAPGKMGEGKGNLVSIGVNLARQGHIVFAYDMVGYNDTNQVDHKFAGSLKHWLWGVSLSGLQLWNSIRVVDYLESLPDVDKNRIGVTGASGGGTQTFLLAAVDDRIKCAVPVNMISAYMQGGCLCENGPGLRVGTDNVEIGAAAAPKAQLLVSATGDWTSKVPTEEWPAIKKVYDLYGAGNKTAVVQFNYQHNYNVESREAMYAFFGKWLLNDANPEHFKERPFEADVKAMHVWNSSNPMPSNALKEADLAKSMMGASEKQLAGMWPANRSALGRFRQAVLPGLRQSLAFGPALPTSPRSGSGGEGGKVIVIAAYKADASKAEELKDSLGKGGHTALVSILEDKTMIQDDLWKQFFTTYNRTKLGDDARTIAEVINSAKGAEADAKVDVVGLGECGLPALFGRALSEVGGKTIIDTAGFDNQNDEAFAARLYAPGLRRIGDVQTAAMLAAPDPLCLFNSSQFKAPQVEKGFKGAGAQLKIEMGSLSPEQIAGWLGGK